MSELADLFPGFAAQNVPTSQGAVFARIGGSGSPVLLLHGTGPSWRSRTRCRKT